MAVLPRSVLTAETEREVQPGRSRRPVERAEHVRGVVDEVARA